VKVEDIISILPHIQSSNALNNRNEAIADDTVAKEAIELVAATRHASHPRDPWLGQVCSTAGGVDLTGDLRCVDHIISCASMSDTNSE
jgi:hypothetical protein